MKILLELNIFVNKLENFYSKSEQPGCETKMNKIFFLKKDIAKIAALEAGKHCESIINLKPKLLAVLPHSESHMHSIFKQELKDLFNTCEYYLIRA